MKMRSELLKSIICVVCILLFSTGSILPAFAADSKGQDFLLAFPLNYDGYGTLSLWVTGEQDTQGVVEIPGLEFVESFEVLANQITRIDLPKSAQKLSTGQVKNLGVRVIADQEISVYGLNLRRATSDAFMALPTDALGLEYLAMSYTALLSSEIAVVGVYNGTEVTITPTTSINGHPANQPFTITLNSNETYQLTASRGQDLTGTSIKATAPVAVLSGNQCAIVPTTHVACDHLVEMMTPVATWGKAFLTVPLATRLNGEVFRVLASEDNTTVSINGDQLFVLNRGEFFETVLTERSEIHTSAPSLVAQFSPGQSFDGVYSDPFMMLIPPSEQFLDNYTFNTLSSGFYNGYVNIVIPSGDTSTIVIDGELVDTSLFQPIGLSGFSGAQVKLDPGSHNIQAPVPFGIYVYGFGSYDSYGYPGGMAFEFINSRGDGYSPNVKLVPMGETIEGLAGDTEDINLNGLIDIGEDLNANNVLDRRTEDVNGNGELDVGEDLNNDAVLDRDTGIFRIEFEPGAVNLQLNLDAFVPGTLQTAFTISRIDPEQDARAVLVVSDGAGNTVREAIEFSSGPSLKDVKLVSILSTNDIDLDASSFVKMPDQISTTADQTRIEWNFASITIDQIEQLDYDVVLRNLLPGEIRLVTHRHELSYTDVNGNSVHREMGEQVVKVLPSVFKVSVGTDRDTYTADEVVSISAAITNLSDFAASTNLRLSVKDASGVVVEQFNLYSEVNVEANGQQTYSDLTFNTANIFAGKYDVHAQLLDDNGQVYASAVATFLIVTPSEDNISANIFTDKAEYEPLESVTVTDRVRNIVPNALVDGMTVKTTVHAPDGKLFWVRTEALPQLLPNTLKDLLYAIPIGDALPGNYRIALTVLDDQGIARAIDETTITVKSTANTGAGLGGLVEVAPNPVFKSENILITAKARNSGNSAFDGATLILSLVDPETETVVAEWTENNIGLQVNDELTFERTWEAWGDIGATYVAVLSTEITGERRTLAHQIITIADKFEVDFSESDEPRLLVLLDEINHCGSDDGNDSDSGSTNDNVADDQDCASSNIDPHGPSNAPLLSEQRSYLEGILNAQGWSYTIVSDKYAFADELRTGSYNAYALFSEQVKLAEQLQQELGEAVFRGEGLLIAGDHDYRNNLLDTTLGIQVRGKLRSPEAIRIEPVENFLAATADYSLTEKVSHVELREAEAVATYPGMSVCSADDGYQPDCNEAAVAVARNQYSYGHSVYVGFDLLAQASLSGADPLFSEWLIDTLEDIKVDASTPLTGSVAPITLSLTNQGIATPGQGIITLPVGSQIIDAGSAISQSDGSLLWSFDLAENATETLTFWLRLPETSGPAHIEVQLKVGSESYSKDYNNLLLTLNLNPSPDLSEVRDELAALKSQHKDYMKAHEKVEKALQYQGQDKPDKALKEALKATGYLTGLDHLDAKAIHRKLAYAIRSLERQLDKEDD